MSQSTTNPTSAREQVRRLLALLPYLLKHPNARTAEVAAMFGVSERQLRADLEVLWFCGLPGLMPGDLIEVDMEAVDGEGVIRVGNAEYLSRPLRLGVEEAVALLIALRALAESVDGDERATARASSPDWRRPPVKRAASPGTWPCSCPNATSTPRSRAPCVRPSPLADACISPTGCRAVTRPPNATSIRSSGSRPTRSVISRRGAGPRRTSGCSASTASRRRRCSTSRARRPRTS